MRVKLGQFWTKQLQEPTQYIYSLFVQDLEKAAVTAATAPDAGSQASTQAVVDSLETAI